MLRSRRWRAGALALALALLVPACGAASGPTGAAGAAGAAAGQGAAAELDAAARAFERYDVAASRAHYRAVLVHPRAAPGDRVTARLALARFAWRFDGDVAAARAELEAALELGHEVSSVWSLRGQIERAADTLLVASGRASKRSVATVNS